MQVKDVLRAKQRDVVTVKRETSVQQAMDLLISNKISCLPVLDDKNHLIGILSDKDIFRRVHEDPRGFLNARVGELMTKDVLVGIPEDELSYIAGIMTNNRIRHVPIVENKELVGLVSVGDIVKTQMEQVEIENRHLRQYIGGDYPA